MHELYLGEKIIKEIVKIAQENKAENILEVNVAIPENEHFTENEFEEILKNQSEETIAKKAKFKAHKEKTDKVYIKDMKIS